MSSSSYSIPIICKAFINSNGSTYAFPFESSNLNASIVLKSSHSDINYYLDYSTSSSSLAF
jgi:hypothetical protein